VLLSINYKILYPEAFEVRHNVYPDLAPFEELWMRIRKDRSLPSFLQEPTESGTYGLCPILGEGRDPLPGPGVYKTLPCSLLSNQRLSCSMTPWVWASLKINEKPQESPLYVETKKTAGN
jgi:hypothetical protein